jgi:hypothetical protein
MYDALVQRIATQLGIPPAVVPALIALMQNESSGNPNAVNPRGGAEGLFQITPRNTANLRAGAEGGLPDFNPRDPTQNVTRGLTWIKGYMGRFGGDIRLAIAASNTGPENVAAAMRKVGANTFTPEVFAALPSETRTLLGRVFGPNVAKQTSAEATATLSQGLRQGQSVMLGHPNTGVPQLDTDTTNPPALPAMQGLVDPTLAPPAPQVIPPLPSPRDSIARSIAGRGQTPDDISAAESSMAQPVAQPMNGSQPPNPRSGVGILGSLISGAPGVYQPVPQPRGTAWHDALPTLGASIGNAFGGASMAQQQQMTNQMAKDAAARQQLESEAAIAASRAATTAQQQRTAIDSATFQDSYEGFYGTLPPETQSRLIRERATPADLTADLAAGNFTEFRRKQAIYGSRQVAEDSASAQAVFEDPAMREHFGWKTPEEALSYIKGAKPKAQLWQIMEAKAGMEAAKAQSAHMLNADITTLQTARADVVKEMSVYVAQQAEAATYAAMEATLKNPNLDPEKRKSIQMAMMTAGVMPGSIDPKKYDSTISGYKAVITDYEARIKRIDPSALITPIGEVPSAPSEADNQKRLEAYFIGTASRQLSAEDEALAAQISEASSSGIIGSAVRGVKTIWDAGKFVANIPASIVGGLIAPFEFAASIGGVYDRDPGFIEAFKAVRQKVTEDAAAGVPGADLITLDQMILIARSDFITASYPTLMPEAVTGPVFTKSDVARRIRSYEGLAYLSSPANPASAPAKAQSPGVR